MKELQGSLEAERKASPPCGHRPLRDKAWLSREVALNAGVMARRLLVYV